MCVYVCVCASEITFQTISTYPSLQGSVLFTYEHWPLGDMQVSVVHGLPSLHDLEAPLQPPWKHVSLSVQLSPSSQGTLLKRYKHRPSTASQLSSVQLFESSQSPAPLHVLILHRFTSNSGERGREGERMEGRNHAEDSDSEHMRNSTMITRQNKSPRKHIPWSRAICLLTTLRDVMHNIGGLHVFGHSICRTPCEHRASIGVIFVVC